MMVCLNHGRYVSRKKISKNSKTSETSTKFSSRGYVTVPIAGFG